jgi:hypothetical protein
MGEVTRANPNDQFFCENFNFFLDTPCVELYTFVNCSIHVADFDVDIEKGE